MPLRPFQQVDVFTSTPYFGNPVAVVLDAQGLSTEQMARFARWTNLSETTFVLPPTNEQADYRVRIFTPSEELPFAGHPTLGTCHAWLQAGGKPRTGVIMQECAAGLITIRQDEDGLSFAAPERQKAGPLAPDALAQIVNGLGLSPDDVVAHQWCHNGPPWQAVLLRSDELVLKAKPDPARMPDIGYLGLIGPSQQTGFAFEVRAFFTGASQFIEDPVTGSLNAALAQWLIGADLAPTRYIARQGTVLNRQGRVHLGKDEQGRVWVGGQSVSCITGEVHI